MKTQIPKTDSIDELARFWDSHDLTDFEDQLEEVHEQVFQRRDSHVTVPLATQELTQLRRLAAARGLDEVDLVHQWVQEKLSQS